MPRRLGKTVFERRDPPWCGGDASQARRDGRVPWDGTSDTMKTFYVYILASHTGVLYIGVTNDLERRPFEHREGRGSAFTARYRITRLVFFEVFDLAVDAIAAEKRLKGWSRAKKVALIRERNPSMRDLSEDW